MRNRKTKQQGFTLIELLIATGVFAVILLLCTSGLLIVARIYYKGLLTARTQEVARTITADISERIQFGGSTVIEGINTGSFCVDHYRYTYTPGAVVTEAAGSRGLLLEDIAPSNCSSPTWQTDVGSNPREFLQPNMRISFLAVSQAGGPNSNLWSISVRLSYGVDNDLFVGDNPVGPGVLCKGNASSHFCAVTSLNTTVQQRVK